jgi:glutamate-1-semialdehyde 2,1-aminomutase
MKFRTSDKLFQTAVSLMPGGVNSPVRAFRSVDRNPLFIERAKGSKIYDADGNEFIDYVGSWGPMILGHANKRVLSSVIKAVKRGTSFGACSEYELKLAALVKRMMPSIELIRMTTSGTEAVMSGVRLARAFTGRNKVIKFDGCYHGHSDSFLIKAGSGMATLGLPDSPGVTPSTAQDTLVANYNDIQSVQNLFEANKRQIAAVIIEPIAGNMGCVPADKKFLQSLRDLCSSEKAVLIFDEVITGFRVARGGAQELYGITPDLTVLGKIIGGGFPVGAYGGKKEIMELVAPSGPVYQAGTLSGNPVAMAAGYETLRIINEDKKFYKKLNKKAEALYRGISELKLPYRLNRAGSMFTLFFTNKNVQDYNSAKASDTKKFSKYFNLMLEQGIYLPPSQFESCFVSAAHSKDDIKLTLTAIYKAI